MVKVEGKHSRLLQRCVNVPGMSLSEQLELLPESAAGPGAPSTVEGFSRSHRMLHKDRSTSKHQKKISSKKDPFVIGPAGMNYRNVHHLPGITVKQPPPRSQTFPEMGPSGALVLLTFSRDLEERSAARSLLPRSPKACLKCTFQNFKVQRKHTPQR